MANLKRDIEKIKEWVDLNKETLAKMKTSFGEGKDLVDEFTKALLRGKPEAAIEALTDFEDVNELIINEAALKTLSTGSDAMEVLGVVWKGLVLVAKVAVQVAALKQAGNGPIPT